MDDSDGSWPGLAELVNFCSSRFHWTVPSDPVCTCGFGLWDERMRVRERERERDDGDGSFFSLKREGERYARRHEDGYSTHSLY